MSANLAESLAREAEVRGAQPGKAAAQANRPQPVAEERSASRRRDRGEEQADSCRMELDPEHGARVIGPVGAVL